MDTRIPPPLVLLIAGGGAWLLGRWVPVAPWTGTPVTVVAVLLALAGLALMAWALIGFIRHRTSVHPMHPERARHLLTDGAYAISRNPIYLADALLLTAWIVWLGQPIGLLMLPLFVLYLQQFQIQPEERVLQQRFGDHYSRYRQTTRRWL